MCCGGRQACQGGREPTAATGGGSFGRDMASTGTTTDSVGSVHEGQRRRAGGLLVLVAEIEQSRLGKRRGDELEGDRQPVARETAG